MHFRARKYFSDRELKEILVEPNFFWQRPTFWWWRFRRREERIEYEDHKSDSEQEYDPSNDELLEYEDDGSSIEHFKMCIRDRVGGGRLS